MNRSLPKMYKGTEMRSGLEVRIAIWLDKHNIPWVYEPEGFEFDGIRYLPDFLIDNSFFLEGKGILDTKSEKKIEALVKGTGYRVIVVDSEGNLDIAANDVYGCVPCYDENGDLYNTTSDEYGYEKSEGMIAKCYECGKWYAANESQNWGCTCCGHSDGDSTFSEVYWGKIDLPNSYQWGAMQ